MPWEMTLRYNGRLAASGQSQTGQTDGDSYDEIDQLRDKLQMDAVRIEGAIFVTGWEVDWLSPVLEDDGEDDVL